MAEGLGTCPFSRMPCMAEACALWAKAANGEREGCTFGLQLVVLELGVRRVFAIKEQVEFLTDAVHGLRQ